MKRVLRTLLHRFGYDVVSFPLSDWYVLKHELLPMFAALRINCVIDVGAHSGGYGSFLRNIGYKGHIVSFEPIQQNYEKLKTRIRADPQWRA